MLFAFCCCCLLTSKSLRYSFFSGGGCSDFLKADDIKAFKCYCLHFVLFFCGSCSEFFFLISARSQTTERGDKYYSDRWRILADRADFFRIA